MYVVYFIIFNNDLYFLLQCESIELVVKLITELYELSIRSKHKISKCGEQIRIVRCLFYHLNKILVNKIYMYIFLFLFIHPFSLSLSSKT